MKARKIENIPFFRCGTEYIDLLLIRAVGIQAGAELEIGSIVRAQLAAVRGTVGTFASGDHMVHGVLNMAQSFVSLVAPFALAGAFGRLDQIVAVLFAENAALLSVLPEEAVPAICRAGSMVADTVHRDGQNFFHW